jgi:hypothetical protein
MRVVAVAGRRVVLMGGSHRWTAQVDSADELVITELIFNNSFSDLTVEQLVALCSCFVYGEKVRRCSSRPRYPTVVLSACQPRLMVAWLHGGRPRMTRARGWRRCCRREPAISILGSVHID